MIWFVVGLYLWAACSIGLLIGLWGSEGWRRGVLWGAVWPALIPAMVVMMAMDALAEAGSR